MRLLLADYDDGFGHNQMWVGCRELRTRDVILMNMLWNDLRYALRLMRRSPGFSAVAVLSLALGIGANSAIYSLFYTVMLRQLPVEHPEQLVELVRDSPNELHWAGYWAWEQYEYLRDHNHVFSGSARGLMLALATMCVVSPSASNSPVSALRSSYPKRITFSRTCFRCVRTMTSDRKS